MTSSNETFRKSSRNTWLAIGLASIALVVSGYLLVQVNGLDREYGHIRSDLPHLESLRASALQQRDEARQQWIEKQGEISNLRDTEADLIAKLADLERSRNSAEKREADASQRAINEQERLEELQARLSEARSTIGNASRIRSEVSQLENKISELEQTIAARQQTLTRIDGDLESQKSERALLEKSIGELREISSGLQSEIDTLGPTVVNLKADAATIARLKAEKLDLEPTIRSLQAERQDAQQTAESITTQLISSREELSGVRGELEQAKQNLGQISDQLKEKQVQLAELTAEAAAARATADAQVARADVATQRIADAGTELIGINEAISKAQEERSAIVSQLTSSTAQLEAVKRELVNLDALRTDVARLTTSKDELEAIKTALDNALPRLREEADEIRTTRIEEAGKLDTVRQNLTQLTARTSVLEEQIALLEAEQNKLKEDTQAASAAAEAAQSSLVAVNVDKTKALAELREVNDRKNDILRQINTAKEELEIRQRALAATSDNGAQTSVRGQANNAELLPDINVAKPDEELEKTQGAEPAQ